MPAESLLKIYTLGVYGYSEEAFFGAILERQIDLFIDIRARRGMRGARYKFVNSGYLQSKLLELGIAYAHLKELAPTQAIRALQDQADQERKLALRSDRQSLCKAYIHEYKRDILRVYKRLPERKFYAGAALARAHELAELPECQPARRPALFCVEGEPRACHRSLVAAEMQRQLNVEIEDITAERE